MPGPCRWSLGGPVRRSLLFTALPILAACSACGGTPAGPATHTPAAATAARGELDAARARWRARGPAAYSVVVSRACECLPEATRPALLVVRRTDGGAGEVVESATYADNGAAVPAEYAAYFYAVEGMFKLVADALSAGADQVSVEYDAELGYPRRVYIDYDAVMADEEAIYALIDLAPLR